MPGIRQIGNGVEGEIYIEASNGLVHHSKPEDHLKHLHKQPFGPKAARHEAARWSLHAAIAASLPEVVDPERLHVEVDWDTGKAIGVTISG